MRTNRTWAPVVVALVMVLALGLVLSGSAAVDAQNTACYRPVGGASFNCGDGGSFVVGDGATLYVQSGGTLDIDAGATTDIGAATMTAATITTATMTAATMTGATATSAAVGLFSLTAGAVITASDGVPITPTVSYQPLTAEGEVTITVAAGTAGRVLVLVNAGTETINIADTGAIKLSAAWAAGQYDSLTMLSDGTNWIELARSNN